MPTFYYIPESDSLVHHGTKGQHWGHRRYQNTDGTWTAEGKARRRKGSFINELKRDAKNAEDSLDSVVNKTKSVVKNAAKRYEKESSKFQKQQERKAFDNLRMEAARYDMARKDRSSINDAQTTHPTGYEDLEVAADRCIKYRYPDLYKRNLVAKAKVFVGAVGGGIAGGVASSIVSGGNPIAILGVATLTTAIGGELVGSIPSGSSTPYEDIDTYDKKRNELIMDAYNQVRMV